MKTNRFFYACLSCALVVLACGSHSPLLMQERVSETDMLAAVCESKGIDSEQKSSADSLNAAAQQWEKKGKKDKALSNYDRAMIMYRLALAEYQLEQTEKQIETIEKDIQDAQGKLSVYSEILKEIKATRK
jgi:hypothetical protein